MSGRSDEELADLLRDLERDLDRLTDRLDAADDETSVRRRPRQRRRPSPGPRPPSPSDLLRFTEEYTIPTVIAVLEATVRSLELLRGGLRLADPERRMRDDSGGDSGRSAGVRGRVARELGDGASAALERTLADLGTALSATELPEDADAREILEDARSLTDEIERRLAESNGARDAGDGRADADRSEGIDRRRTDERGRTRRRRGDRDRRRRSPSRGVGIEVRDADEGRDGAARADTSDRDDGDAEGDEDAADEAQVDVDAELESIRREMSGDSDDSDDSDDGEDGGDKSPDEDA